jgi:hypothetical protein
LGLGKKAAAAAAAAEIRQEHPNAEITNRKLGNKVAAAGKSTEMPQPPKRERQTWEEDNVRNQQPPHLVSTVLRGTLL